MPRFDSATFATAIETFHITEIPMVPAMLLAALSSPLVTPACLASVRQIWTAGAPLSLSVQDRFRALLPTDARIVPVYGMTECGWITSLAYPDDSPDTSVGRPVPGLALQIIDAVGHPVMMDDTPGELLVRPAHPTLGYVRDPTASAALFHSPGWIRSGDVAYTRGGRVFVVDRVKDLIKVRAWQVSPAELEAVLLRHPRVRDVAVVGVPDEGGSSGEVPFAFVVLNGGDGEGDGEEEGWLGVGEVRRFMEGRLARYKWVKGVRVVREIPRNAAGKVLRRGWREGGARGGVDVKGAVERAVEGTAQGEGGGLRKEQGEGVSKGESAEDVSVRMLQPHVEALQSGYVQGSEKEEEEKELGVGMGAGVGTGLPPLRPQMEELWGQAQHTLQPVAE